MRRISNFAWPTLAFLVFLIAGSRCNANAQTLRGLNQTLNEIEPTVARGETDPGAASEAIDRLDQAEADFARVAEQGRVDQEELLVTYHQLEQMLDRLYQTY